MNEGIFYARLILEVDGEIHEIDSRPSDAVALGVRFKAPIYSYESVLAEAGIVIEDEEEGGESYDQSDSDFSLAEIERSDPLEEEDPQPASLRSSSDKATLNQLKKKLDEALSSEDYEEAARIRDRIKRLNEE
ncbi:MAG: bifunctional nuclease domain-containing protein [Bacteroidota bacterium]